MCSFWSTLKCSRTFGEPKEDISFIYNNIKWQTHSWRMIMFYSHLFLENIYIKFVDRGTMRSILSFWSKLIDGKQSKLSSLIYRLLYLKTHGNNTFSWISFVKSILDDCGFSNVWHTQNFISHKWLIEINKLILNDQFKQNWHWAIGYSSRNLDLKKYLDVLNDKNRFMFCRFRTSNHRLPIEVGRWANVESHNRQ
jgi:hypothetical protein